MCDDSKVNGLLIGAGPALATAIAGIITAIAFNNSFFGAWQAPLWMGVTCSPGSYHGV